MADKTHTTLSRKVEGMSELKFGTRIRLNERCGWAWRRGCEGVVVDAGPKTDPVHDTVILLDRDPMVSETAVRDQHERGWSVVVRSVACDVLEPESPVS